MSNHKQNLLGTPEEGFIRPLRETDEQYIKANSKLNSLASKLISMQNRIKEMKDEAMAPIKDELKSCSIKLDALEFLYAYMRISKALEDARIQSIEEVATIVVYVISDKLTKRTDWCLVKSQASYFEDSVFFGLENVFEVAMFSDGKLLGKDGKPEASEEAIKTRKQDEMAA